MISGRKDASDLFWNTDFSSCFRGKGNRSTAETAVFFFGIFQLCLMAVGILPIDNEDTAVQQNTV